MENGRYHGGLLFSAHDDDILKQFARSVACTLEDYGHPVERQTVMNRKQAGVTASQYHVSLTLNEPAPVSDQMQRARRLDAISHLNQSASASPAFHNRLKIDISAADPKRDDKEISELILVVMLYRLVELCEAHSVEWLSPDSVLTLEQFLAPFTSFTPGFEARDQAEPARPAELSGNLNSNTYTKTRQSPEPERDALHVKQAHGSEEDTLAQAFRVAPNRQELNAIRDQDDTQNDIRRLATWGMTGMMVFLSTPVAASMAAVNLIKGEDFRLNTQVLSLSGLLVTLQSTGALASVVSNLPL